MLTLESLAQQVVDRWESGDLAAAVRELDRHLKTAREDRKSHEETIETARKTYADDDVAIDDQPQVSVADNGVWVSAWVWVPVEN